MKRNLDLITDDVKEAIKEWLALGIDGVRACPFTPSRCTVCRAIFPSLPLIVYFDISINGICPCDCFSLSYVRKVARQVIRETS